jgi:hypothetical protein
MILAIIDHVHDHKPTLKACSLVCKAWTHPARLHLFSRVILKWPLQPAAFPFVRCLLLLMDRSSHGPYGVPAWDEVVPLLVGFHRVVSLEVFISEQYLNTLSPQTWLALGKTFSKVVSLRLSCVTLSDASSFTRVVCAFFCLRELRMHVSLDLTFQVPESSFATTFRLSPHLDTLELNMMALAAVLEWLLSLPVRPTLRTVRLYNLRPADCAIIHKFIGVFGTGLESLSLSTLTKDCALPYIV